MAFINARAQILHGRGGGRVAIDNVTIATGEAGGWVDDDTVADRAAAFGWAPALYDVRTGLSRRAIDDPTHPLYDKPAGLVCADGGVWAAWFGDKAEQGLYASTGLRLPEGGLLGVGPTGEIGFKARYQSGGPSMVLERTAPLDLDADGLPRASWMLTGGHAYELQLLGARRAIWREGTQIMVAGLPPVRQIGNAWRPTALLIAGRWWVTYFSDQAGVVLHPFDSVEGYRVVPAGVDCWHSARVLADGRVRFVLANGEGEQTVDALTVDVTWPREDLEPHDPIVAIGGDRWCGWFTGTPEPGGGWTTDADPTALPGNCYIVIPGGEIKTDDGRRIGWYVEGRPADTNVDDINRAIAAARVAHPGDRVVAYWPRQTIGRPSGADGLAVEGYRLLNEPIPQYEVRCRVRIAAAGAWAWFIPQVFSSNLGLTQDLRSIPPVAARIARDTGAHLVMFNGTGRKTGYQEHPEVHADWQAVFAGVTGQPALEEFMDPWKVTIKSFDPTIARGQAFTTKVAFGNGVEAVFEKDGKDEIHIAVYKDGVLQDRSGLARHVEVTG
jgi:hypothetical protein